MSDVAGVDENIQCPNNNEFESSSDEFEDSIQFIQDVPKSVEKQINLEPTDDKSVLNTESEQSESESNKFQKVKKELLLYKSKSIESMTTAVYTKDCRAGRYNKKAAPLPPPKNDSDSVEEKSKCSNSSEVSTIKATLILQPGMVKHNPNTDIFVHSPKLRRKFPQSKKLDSSFSRLMMLPKKLHFWHSKNESSNPNVESDMGKIPSWYEALPTSKHLMLLHSKQRSKSDSNFEIRNLTQSPGEQRHMVVSSGHHSDVDLD